MRKFLRRTMIGIGIAAGCLIVFGLMLASFAPVLEATGYRAVEPQTHSAPAPAPAPKPAPAPAPAPALAPAPAPAPAPTTRTSTPIPAPVQPTTQAPAPASQGITPDQADQIYLLVLRNGGIPVPDQVAAITSAINLGHNVCQGFQAGLSEDTIGLTIMSQGGFSPAQAGTIVGSAVSAYCPQYSDLIGG